MPISEESTNPLIVGDERKLLVKIHQGQGPARPPWGQDGKGKPRYVQIDQPGQTVAGTCFIGKKAENGVKLEVIVSNGVVQAFLV